MSTPPTSLRQDVYQALQQFDLLDFAVNLAAATGAFETVTVEVLSDDRYWQAIAGYQVVKQQARIINTRPVSMLNQKKAIIVETDRGEFWATPEQITTRFFTYNNYHPVSPPYKITRIIPSTGY